MTKEDDEASTDAGIPSFAEAVQERKKHIAWLRKKGDHERADLIAKCRKDIRCLLGDCPVCDRRRQLAFSRYPELAIHDSTEDELDRFVLYELSVDAIKVIGPRRPIDEKKLAPLKASIKLIGLQTPITVRMQKSKFVLVTGWYRLTAVKQLGKATISCFCSQIDGEMDLYLWQRAENVYRAEPRVLEKAEYIDEMRQGILQEGGASCTPRRPSEEERGHQESRQGPRFHEGESSSLDEDCSDDLARGEGRDEETRPRRQPRRPS
jgi:hypothetical protein